VLHSTQVFEDAIVSPCLDFPREIDVNEIKPGSDRPQKRIIHLSIAFVAASLMGQPRVEVNTENSKVTGASPNQKQRTSPLTPLPPGEGNSGLVRPHLIAG
jgi:hypothetical protein